ncbi:hypothetical protein Y032_0621g746 [Ancylostoma ceylanicum]|uniref:Uncharacterized protein n=1 Tax=Ancylostoma ceylanicum TaxID=53326 RepID=A0A016WKA3_9BILA|nr:hypothetical protein Y032_0621g746 [Ancylostoma ceylanicum]
MRQFYVRQSISSCSQWHASASVPSQASHPPSVSLSKARRWIPQLRKITAAVYIVTSQFYYCSVSEGLDLKKQVENWLKELVLETPKRRQMCMENSG